jgi:hypothetical protein
MLKLEPLQHKTNHTGGIEKKLTTYDKDTGFYGKKKGRKKQTY